MTWTPRKSPPPLGENAERIKRLILADPEITARELSGITGLTTQRVYQIINTLENRGELEIDEDGARGSVR